jgi:hypothetical protein
MTSPVVDFIDQFGAALAVHAPHVDGTGLGYREIETPGTQGGELQHRMFTWEEPTTAKWVRGHGAAMPVIAYDPVKLIVWIHKGNRTKKRFTKDLIEEIATITRLYLAQTESRPAGVEGAVLGTIRFEPSTGRLIFPFRVTAQETA